MSITRIRYDERQFSSAEQCLSEVAIRLQRGWTLSGITALGGRIRAVFAWSEECSPDGTQAAQSSIGGTR